MRFSPFSPAALTLLTISLSPNVGAQPRLDAVVVTATGRAAESLQTPQAVEVLDVDRAEPSAPPGSLFVGRPGMAVQSDGAWGQNPVLRGLRKESIAVLVDGVRVNSAQPQGALASFVDLGLLDRVEVVQGPSAVLYGSGAMGGAVNLITPQARFSSEPTLGGRFGLGLGTTKSGALLVERSGPDHALVVGAAANDTDDYRSPDGREPHTGYRSDSLLAKYAFRVAPGVSLRLNLQRHAVHDVWYPGSARTGGRPGGAGIPPPLGTVTIRSPEQRRELAEFGLDAQLGPGQLSAEVWHQDVFRQIRAFSARLGRDYVRNDVTFSTDGVRARYVLPMGQAQMLTAGAESWRMRADPERYMDNNAPFFNNNQRNDPFDQGSLRSSGLFVQDEIEWGRARIIAGARYDRIEGDAHSKGAGPAMQTTGLEHTDDTLSWSLGVLYPLADGINAYANVGRAWRAADMRERFEDSARGDGYYHVGNPQLDPERSTSVEVGLKGSAKGVVRSGNVDYRVSAYRTRIDDYIAGRITGAIHPGSGLPIKLTQNLDEAVIRGIEGVAAIPLGRFVVDLAFTWLRGDNRQDDKPLAFMPPPEASIGIGQATAQGPYWRTALRAVKRQDRVGTRFTAGTENETPGFVTADALLGWRFGKVGGLSDLRAELRMINLFDRGYHEHLTEGVSGEELLAPGRSASLSLRGSF
jgi:hemoglobin/transferrin/lactoferrin receptor protein